MKNCSDSELVTELLHRLEIKDSAYHDLMVLTSKLEELNKRLIESEKVKSHFLSNIKNEINNPLTSMLIICDLIISGDGMGSHEAVKSLVSTAYKEAFNLSFQLNNIFAAAEIEAGEFVPGFSTVDVGSVASSTINMFRNRAAEKKIEVRLDVNGDMKFTTDAEKLQLILANLLSNAIEFSNEAAAVDVVISKENAILSLTVADHGAGIDDNHRDLIFERFRQLDSGSTKGHCGHGLGLSVVKALVELLDGTITVGGRPGHGPVFSVTVPERAAVDGTDVISLDGNEYFFGEAENGERF